jgi:hypothetical protein
VRPDPMLAEAIGWGIVLLVVIAISIWVLA